MYILISGDFKNTMTVTYRNEFLRKFKRYYGFYNISQVIVISQLNALYFMRVFGQGCYCEFGFIS